MFIRCVNYESKLAPLNVSLCAFDAPRKMRKKVRYYLHCTKKFSIKLSVLLATLTGVSLLIRLLIVGIDFIKKVTIGEKTIIYCAVILDYFSQCRFIDIKMYEVPNYETNKNYGTHSKVSKRAFLFFSLLFSKFFT